MYGLEILYGRGYIHSGQTAGSGVDTLYALGLCQNLMSDSAVRANSLPSNQINSNAADRTRTCIPFQVSAPCTADLQSAAQTAPLNGTAAGTSKTPICARRKHFGGGWQNTHDHFDRCRFSRGLSNSPQGWLLAVCGPPPCSHPHHLAAKKAPA